jgi:hypothetical protein
MQARERESAINRRSAGAGESEIGSSDALP